MKGSMIAFLLSLGGCSPSNPFPVGVSVPWQTAPQRVMPAGNVKPEEQIYGVVKDALVTEKAARDYAKRDDADVKKINDLTVQSKKIRIAPTVPAMRAAVEEMKQILNQGD